MESFYYVKYGAEDMYINMRYINAVMKDKYVVRYTVRHNIVWGSINANQLYKYIQYDPNFILVDGIYINKESLLSVGSDGYAIFMNFADHHRVKSDILPRWPRRLRYEKYEIIKYMLADTHYASSNAGLWNKNSVAFVSKVKGKGFRGHHAIYKDYNPTSRLYLDELPNGLTRIANKFYNLHAISIAAMRKVTKELFLYTHFGRIRIGYDNVTKILISDTLLRNGFIKDTEDGEEIYYIKKADISKCEKKLRSDERLPNSVWMGNMIYTPYINFIYDKKIKFPDHFIHFDNKDVNTGSIIYANVSNGPSDSNGYMHIYTNGSYRCAGEKICEMLNKANIINKGGEYGRCIT